MLKEEYLNILFGVIKNIEDTKIDLIKLYTIIQGEEGDS